ncbi:MAG: hypothetical protein IJP62_10605 [Treponema sp.]|nr:hypothetical protein [Treponema sp.]
MNETMEIETKQNLIAVMQQENELLDVILEQQSVLHECVSQKDWERLEGAMANLQVLSDKFVELESERTALSENIVLAADTDIAPVLTQVRGKLQRSKIENHALNVYIKTTRKFLQGVFDSVVPQRRNTLYSRTGKIIRPELSSLVLNQVM